MHTRTKHLTLILVLAFILSAVASDALAQRASRLHTRARMNLVERHYSELTTNHEGLEQQVRALAARLGELEERLAHCGCPAPECLPCQEQGLCAGEAACGRDADKDGIDDCHDRCPCERGVADTAGCPPPPDLCHVCETCELVPCGHDADIDGLDDCQDACPCRPGAIDHEGCPSGDACTTDTDCDDSNGCSLDACDGGICRHECMCVSPTGFECCPGPATECPAP
jgi:hypothetical protein